jgi:hypothetical protein
VEIMVICVVVTGIAVLVGLGFGLYALRLAKGHAEASSLHLMALNLLEPPATMAVLLAVLGVTHGLDMKNEAVVVIPVIASIPLTWMLLAPLWSHVSHLVRGTLIAFGLLRWLNTIAGWVIGGLALTQTSSNDFLMLAGGLIVSGTLILCLSVMFLASSLSDFRAPSQPFAATDSPRA